MPTLHLASTNPHKLAEFQRLCGNRITLLPAPYPSSADPWMEDGLMFMDNAIKKAVSYSHSRPGMVLADDSGLCVASLAGAPGVNSARYAGPRATDAENRQLLLDRLAHLAEEERGAAFFCALALARAGEILATAEASCPGRIARFPRGTGGFGYDPLFIPSDASATFAEMAPEEKDRYSHRARAIARLFVAFPLE